jgi:hypothetical protein
MMLCRLGIHKWRDCKQAAWRMEYVTMTLGLSACARCGVIRKTDAEQLAYLAPLAPCAYVIEAQPVADGGSASG